MRVINVLAAVAAISLAGGAAAAKDKPAAPKEKKICQVVQPAIGRIPERRICKTKAEWEAASVQGKPAQGNRYDAQGAASGRD